MAVLVSTSPVESALIGCATQYVKSTELLLAFPLSNDKSSWEVLVFELMQFLAGRITSDELLKRCEQKKLSPTLAHYYIGLVRLAENNRPAAIAGFELAFRDRDHFISAQLEDGYLLRLKQDSDWPSWLNE